MVRACLPEPWHGQAGMTKKTIMPFMDGLELELSLDSDEYKKNGVGCQPFDSPCPLQLFNLQEAQGAEA
jgi:hypothetical protein